MPTRFAYICLIAASFNDNSLTHISISVHFARRIFFFKSLLDAFYVFLLEFELYKYWSRSQLSLTTKSCALFARFN